MDWPTRDDVARTAYEANEQRRAYLEGGSLEPWTPWEKQTSRRERFVAEAMADAILALFEPLRADLDQSREETGLAVTKNRQLMEELAALRPVARAAVRWYAVRTGPTWNTLEETIKTLARDLRAGLLEG